MKTLNEEKFKELASRTGDLVISIYTPTSKQSTDNYQTDKNLFKNKLKEIGRELQSIHQLEEEEIKKLLKPAQDLLDDLGFWQNNDKMLTYFIFDGKEELYQLPINIQNPIHLIGKKPFLLPMIPELNNDGSFYLLHLDLERIQLFEGSRNNFREIELDGEEISLSFAEEEENEQLLGIRKRQGFGGAGEMFQGHGEGPGEDRKVLIRNYFHRMTKMLDAKLHENPLPLYLAGLDYLIPMFNQATKYTHLKQGHIGRLNGMNLKEIHQKAWALAEGHFLEERQKRKEEFGFRESRNLAISKDDEKLIKAAMTGGVDTLLVNTNHKHLWGSFNSDDFTVEFDKGPTGKNHCMIDMAAAKVIDAGGKVYMVTPEEMPGDTLIAGTLRYEV